MQSTKQLELDHYKYYSYHVGNEWGIHPRFDIYRTHCMPADASTRCCSVFIQRSVMKHAVPVVRNASVSIDTPAHGDSSDSSRSLTKG